VRLKFKFCCMLVKSERGSEMVGLKNWCWVKRPLPWWSFLLVLAHTQSGPAPAWYLHCLFRWKGTRSGERGKSRGAFHSLRTHPLKSDTCSAEKRLTFQRESHLRIKCTNTDRHTGAHIINLPPKINWLIKINKIATLTLAIVAFSSFKVHID